MSPLPRWRPSISLAETLGLKGLVPTRFSTVTDAPFTVCYISNVEFRIDPGVLKGETLAPILS